MVIKNLKLVNFRNFEFLEVGFSSRKTLILGPNGAGKSSILEAIYLLSSGESLRTENDAEMIKFGSEYAKIQAEFADDSETVSLDLTLNKNPEGRLVKTALLNGVKKPAAAFWGTCKVVEFGPEDINLVAGPPESRRRYLNSILNQVSLEYRQDFLSYEKARRQKNYLLDQIREGTSLRGDLTIWNQQMLTLGTSVQKWRQKYLEYLNDNLEGTGFNYFPSELSPARLEEFVEREIAAGSALIGPHRDDFEFEFEVKSQKSKVISLSSFGSRGQQRMGVFELKLGELKYFRDLLRVEPLLLLDDIFSELDEAHRDEVWLELTGGVSQVILTATGAETIEPKYLKEAKIINI